MFLVSMEKVQGQNSFHFPNVFYFSIAFRNGLINTAVLLNLISFHKVESIIMRCWKFWGLVHDLRLQIKYLDITNLYICLLQKRIQTERNLVFCSLYFCLPPSGKPLCSLVQGICWARGMCWFLWKAKTVVESSNAPEASIWLPDIWGPRAC